MGDLLFDWTAPYQTCLQRACVPRSLSGLFQLFDLRLIWPLTSTLPCLFIKQCLTVFGRQAFLVCSGPNIDFVYIVTSGILKEHYECGIRAVKQRKANAVIQSQSILREGHLNLFASVS